MNCFQSSGGHRVTARMDYGIHHPAWVAAIKARLMSDVEGLRGRLAHYCAGENFSTPWGLET
jgi:hypothetical protein